MEFTDQPDSVIPSSASTTEPTASTPPSDAPEKIGTLDESDVVTDAPAKASPSTHPTGGCPFCHATSENSSST
jgi:hypothetical protein